MFQSVPVNSVKLYDFVFALVGAKKKNRLGGNTDSLGRVSSFVACCLVDDAVSESATMCYLGVFGGRGGC